MPFSYPIRDSTDNSFVLRMISPRSIVRNSSGSRLLLVHSSTAASVCNSISVGYDGGMKSSSAAVRSSASRPAWFSSAQPRFVFL